MSPFLSGALGAAALLLVAGSARHLAWRLGRRRFRGHGVGWLAARIHARPDQEELLRAEAEAIFAELRGVRGELHGGRSALAELLADPAADEAAFDAILSRQGARLERARARVAQGLARVHAALDPTQRAALAALIRRGPQRLHHRWHAHA